MRVLLDCLIALLSPIIHFSHSACNAVYVPKAAEWPTTGLMAAVQYPKDIELLLQFQHEESEEVLQVMLVQRLTQSKWGATKQIFIYLQHYRIPLKIYHPIPMG
jgi:hypothetical protein